MLFKKNNQPKNQKLNVEFKQFTRCDTTKSKKNVAKSVTKRKLSFDIDSQQKIDQAIKCLLKKGNMRKGPQRDKVAVVLPGIINRKDGKVRITFTNPREDSNAIVESHWPQITHRDVSKAYPGNHAIVDNNVGRIYREIFSGDLMKPTTHIQLVHEAINESNPQNPVKVTVEHLVRYSGFALTIYMNDDNNKLVVKVDGKSSGLNSIAPFIFEVMQEEKLMEVTQDQAIEIKNKFEQRKRNSSSKNSFLYIKDANKIKQLVYTAIDQTIINRINQKIDVITNYLSVMPKKADPECGFFQSSIGPDYQEKLDQIINSKNSNNLIKLAKLEKLLQKVGKKHMQEEQFGASQVDLNLWTSGTLRLN